MEGKGSKRNPNFSHAESNLLLQLVEKYKNIIENRKPDSAGRYEKAKAWDRIVGEFNEKNVSDIYRDKFSLTSKYDNLKKTTKRKACEEKKYSCGTGGGPSKPADFNDLDNKVIELLGDERVEGLPSFFDNDGDALEVADETNIEVEPTDDDETLVEEDDSAPVVMNLLDPTWGKYTVNHLRQAKSAPLLTKNRQPVKTVTVPLQDEDNQPKESAGKNVQKKTCVSSYIEKRAELHNTRPFKKNAEKDTWGSVGKAKLELLDIQKEIALEELRQKKRQDERLEEEHQLKIRHMEEIHKLKLQLLRAEFENLNEK